MTERCEKAISLGTLSETGGQYFMFLQTGRRINCHRWEELPITKEVIDRVESLAQEEGQLRLINKCPLFEWEDGKEVKTDDVLNEEDEVYIDEYDVEDVVSKSSNEEEDIMDEQNTRVKKK